MQKKEGTILQKKEDLRHKRNRITIEKSFMTLLEEKPLHRITVKEIAELAMINRNTFYLHYTNIEELYRQIEQKLLQQLPSYLPKEKTLSSDEMRQYFAQLVAAIQENREIYIILFKNPQTNEFETKIKQTLLAPGLAVVKNYTSLPAEAAETISLRLDFIGSGILGVLESWLIKHPHITANEISNIIYSLYSSGGAQIKSWQQ